MNETLLDDAEKDAVMELAEATIAAEHEGTLSITVDELNTTLQERQAPVRMVEKDWHDTEHSQAIVTDRLLGNLEFQSPSSKQLYIEAIDHMFEREVILSRRLHDTRELEDKPTVYFRRILRHISNR